MPHNKNTPNSNKIVVYVDGACKGNPGAGGWGVYICYPNTNTQELCGGAASTTNNRMELTAAIEGLKATSNQGAVEVWTDSSYVQQGISQWITNWKKNSWRKADKKPVLNADLWQQLDALTQQRDIAWHWVKGHAGHAGNEKADELANLGVLNPNGLANTDTSLPLQTESTPLEKKNDWLMSDPLGLGLEDEPQNNDQTISQTLANNALTINTIDIDDAFAQASGQNEDNTLESFHQTPSAQAPALTQNIANTLKVTNLADLPPTQVMQPTLQNVLVDLKNDLTADGSSNNANIADSLLTNTIIPIPSTLGKRQLILDTETTGLHHQQGDRIIELGVLEFVNRKFTGQKIHLYFKPDRSVGDSARIHGITDDFLQDKPDFSQFAQPLWNYLKQAEIVAHNAQFDIGFLNAEFSRVGLSPITEHSQVLDTWTMAKQKYPGQKNSLDALVRRYDIPARDRTFHGALLDAEILADVYLAMTGGQVLLDIDHSEDGTQKSKAHQRFEAITVKVQRANQKENQQHQDWLEAFEKKSGKPALWASVDN